MANGIAQALPLLDAWIAYSVMQQQVPSVAIAVVHGDQPVWTKVFGWADVRAKTAATPQTRYRVGSITKTFTALAILQLYEDGRLTLDDRARDHVTTTAINARNAGRLDVTLRELLTHSAGLERDLPGTRWSGPSFPAQFPDHFRATYPSSTEWKYSNVGYALLGEVVAAAGGELWAQHVERRILGPLGMTGSTASPKPDEAGLAVGYARPTPGEPHVPTRHTDHGVVSPAASIVSTIEDMGRWLAFHMSGGGPVLGAKNLREMHRPQWLMDDWQIAWGLGMRVRRVDGRVRVGHSGNTPGFAALMEFIPELKLGVAVLTNADDGNPAGFCDYALQLLSPIAAKETARAATAEDAERYCGLYRSENGNMTMFVALLDDQLTLVSPGATNPYASRIVLERGPGPHVFIMRSSVFGMLHFGEHLTFTTGANGEVTGYDMASSACFIRESAFVPVAIEQLCARPEALYAGIERRKQLQEIYSGVDRRKESKAPYSGVERRAGGNDRRGQRRAVH